MTGYQQCIRFVLDNERDNMEGNMNREKVMHQVTRREMKGYIHIYTGNGKGKTTAALGLAIRAAGAGLQVLLAQFIKGRLYSELKALSRFSDQITVEQFGLPHFIYNKPSLPDIEAARYGFEKVKSSMLSGRFDMIIIDEGNVAVTCGLISKQEMLDLIDIKPENLELVITGRGALPEIIDKADLVTEMKDIKHYYDKGVDARIGIEK
jgi:cob(I)alamin adenosyltransferase